MTSPQSTGPNAARGRLRFSLSVDALAGAIADRIVDGLAARGLKLDTEGGEVIAKLADAGGRGLD